MRRALLILSLAASAFGRPAPDTPRGQNPAGQPAHYELSVRVLPNTRRIEVTGTMRLPPATTDRDRIEFLLWSRMQNVSAQLIEPKDSVPSQELSSDGAEGDRKWTLKLGRPVPAGEPALLQFSYASDGGDPAPQFKISPAGSYAGGGGELWYPQIAFKNRDLGTLRFSVPAGETVVSNGTLRSTPRQKSAGEYVFSVTEPVKFGFAAGLYTVYRRPGSPPFSLYLLRRRKESQTRAIFDGCARVQKFLSGLFGAFPHKEFKFVEVDFRPSIISGLGEFGFILADDSKIDDFDLAYWAHEFGHQWWGDLITGAPNTVGQMMLTEGLAQFGALLAVEKLEGSAAAEQFRRSGYRGKTQSAAGYFRLVQAGTDFPLTAFVPKNQGETTNIHRLANSKGFILLDMLSRRIGREKFAAILRKFIKEKAGGLTSWPELQQAVERGAGQDVRWFFEQWFERTGAPDYQLTWEQDGRTVRGVITQPAPYFRAALEVEAVGSDRRLLRTIEVVGGRTEFNWTVPFKVTSVILDPHYKVLRWLPEFHSQPPR